MRQTTFWKNFPGLSKVFLAVIHLTPDDKLNEDNINAAASGRADGLLLIDQHPSSSWENIMTGVNYAAEQWPKLWRGVNYLGGSPHEVYDRMNVNVKGIWADNGMINENVPAHMQPPEVMFLKEKLSNWDGVYFGGVAFKTQRKPNSYVDSAIAAVGNMDVITTSGPGTGLAPDLEKITDMKDAVGYAPLAIASGMNIENIHWFLPLADCFIIGTGIEDSPYRVNIAKVRALKDAINILNK